MDPKDGKQSQDHKLQPVIFVNNPISSDKNDVIGFDSQIQTVCNAVENGATMIGIIADYGTGKSSMTEFIKNDFLNRKHPEPIKINLWDSIPDGTCETQNGNSDDVVSILTKSFLFQLANGHSRKLGGYVNKLLSKNYGTISFASNHIVKLIVCLLLSALFYTLYKMTESSGTGIMQFLPEWCLLIASVLRIVAPVFVLVSAVFAFWGIKDICIAFSHWKMAESKRPEICDVFDIYRIIIDEISPRKNKKQLVFIDDLDRISDKTAVIAFLKELYRFQDSIASDKSRFVFVVSVMPESNLPGSKNGEKNVYHKLFDTTVYLKPIHFDDYDSILLEMIKSDTTKFQALKNIAGEEFEDVLPESFKWIKRGTNLTIRDLKERLNQAISIMVSLKSKSYKENSAADFQACTAVAYLENRFPKDYYALLKSEEEFAEFMKKSLPIIDSHDERSIEELKDAFDSSFVGKAFSKDFESDLCSMIIDKIFDDDFRMYFYTYPKGSHIKTTYEKEICDYLLFPNLQNSYAALDDAVTHAYKNGNNNTVIKTIKSLSSYPIALLKNDKLFLEAANISIEKLFSEFHKVCIEITNFEDNDLDIWRRMTLLDQKNFLYFVKKTVDSIVTLPKNSQMQFRRIIILALTDRIDSFQDLFIGAKNPIITKEEMELLDNPVSSLLLVNENLLNDKNYYYISKETFSTSLKDKSTEAFEKALRIMDIYTRVMGTDISNDMLEFLRVNCFLDDNAFEYLCPNAEENKLVNYLNMFDAEQLSDLYLLEVDKRCISNGLSDKLIEILIERDLFSTALTHIVYQGTLNDIDFFESKSKEILDACKVINNTNSDTIVSIRKEAYLSRGIESYSELFFSPYPVITYDEYINTPKAETAINLIDTDRIEDGDYHVISMIESRSYSVDELLMLFAYLFDLDSSNVVANLTSRRELIKRIDFKKLNLKRLSFEQREQIFTYIIDIVDVNNEDDAVSFQKRIGGFIPTLEKAVQGNTEYHDMIKTFDEFSDITLKWLADNYLLCGLSEKLCQILYEKKYYKNYIIASTLRENTLVIENKIPIEYYFDVYKNVPEMFSIMSKHWEFLEKFEQFANLSEFDYGHVVPAFAPKQYARFFDFVDGLSDEKKIHYFKSFGKIVSLEDSKAFRSMICKPENIELLGSWDIYHHVKEQLWDDAPYEKARFTRIWNQRWKKELEYDTYNAK